MRKPLLAHFAIVNNRHSVVNRAQQIVRLCRDDSERVQYGPGVKILPGIPQASERERLFVF